MSASKNGRRVEFLARVRYSNQLPPPPFAPKSVKYDVPTEGLLNAGSLSAVFLQRGVNPETDIELGMPLDLSVLDTIFDPETCESVMCPQMAEDAEISPEDAALLGEPQVSGATASSHSGRSFAQSAGLGAPGSASSSGITTGAGTNLAGSAGTGVERSSSEIGMGTSFLRRTAYMSGDMRRSTVRKNANLASDARDGAQSESRTAAAIRRIEQSFTDVKAPLSTLRHPSRPNVHAVSSLPLFPDSQNSDLTFSEIKMLGSAALTTIPREFSSEELRSSVFYASQVDIGAEQKYEWMSFLTLESEAEAVKMSQYRTELRDTLPAAEAKEEEESKFVYNKLQDSDFSVLRAKHRFENVVISQGPHAFSCVPVSARYSLRRRRVPPHLQSKTASEEFEVLDLGLRELTPQESIQRDEVRSIYDPVNYG